MTTSKNQTLIDYVYSNFNNVPKGDPYERLLSGMKYDLRVPQLAEYKIRAKERCRDYANLRLDDFESLEAYLDGRAAALRGIFGRIGDGATVEPPFTVDYGCNIEIGERFFSNSNLTVLDCAVVTIGDNVLLGPNVLLIAAGHSLSVANRNKGVEAAPVVIEDDVWLGAGVTVVPGVRVGKGSVVGAGAVVTKDVPPYSLAVGAPARVIRKVTYQDAEDKKRECAL